MFSLFINNISFFLLGICKSSLRSSLSFFKSSCTLICLVAENLIQLSFYENKISLTLTIVTSCASKLLNFQFENSFSLPLCGYSQSLLPVCLWRTFACAPESGHGQDRYFFSAGWWGGVWSVVCLRKSDSKFLPSIQVRGCTLKFSRRDLFMFSLLVDARLGRPLTPLTPSALTSVLQIRCAQCLFLLDYLLSLSFLNRP